jgi:hypothetical protein
MEDKKGESNQNIGLIGLLYDYFSVNTHVRSDTIICMVIKNCLLSESWQESLIIITNINYIRISDMSRSMYIQSYCFGFITPIFRFLTFLMKAIHERRRGP